MKKSPTCTVLSKPCFLLFHEHGEEAVVIAWHQSLQGVTLLCLDSVPRGQYQFHILYTSTHKLSLLDITPILPLKELLKESIGTTKLQLHTILTTEQTSNRKREGKEN